MADLIRWEPPSRFRNRVDDLSRLEEWWSSTDGTPINMYGRRRVGKSWLFRTFANGKPGIILVADQLAEGDLLARFGHQLAPLFSGIPPTIGSVPELFRVLFRAAAKERLLVVIDEFQWLLPTRSPERVGLLSAIQAVMEEERDESRLKLILCGSAVTQMRALQEEKNPLYGRLRDVVVRPLPWQDARLFFEESSLEDAFTRFGISGGIPTYLAALSGGSISNVITDRFLSPASSLYNEGRFIIASEFEEPATHLSIIQQLAAGPKEIGEIGNAIAKDSGAVSAYVDRLRDLGIMRRETPFGADEKSRGGQWILDDSFLRFWFRFVMPHQAELDAGLRAETLYRESVKPHLADHTAPIFEEQCRRYLRSLGLPNVVTVRRWWGNALDDLRRSGERYSEEIDLVGGKNGRVMAVGEAKWQTRPVGIDVITNLRRFKIPALRQYLRNDSYLRNPLDIYVFSKAGFTEALKREAAEDPHVTLVSLTEVLGA